MDVETVGEGNDQVTEQKSLADRVDEAVKVLHEVNGVLGRPTYTSWDIGTLSAQLRVLREKEANESLARDLRDTYFDGSGTSWDEAPYGAKRKWIEAAKRFSDKYTITPKESA